jgi:hypothetical protein
MFGFVLGCVMFIGILFIGEHVFGINPSLGEMILMVAAVLIADFVEEVAR